MSDRLPIGSGIAPYVKPPEAVFAFRCRCGRHLAVVDYRHPQVATWLTYRMDTYYCAGCGTRLGAEMGPHVWLTDMVRWARGKRRGVRLWGLKEEEEHRARAARFDQSEGRESYYHPTPPEFLECGC